MALTFLLDSANKIDLNNSLTYSHGHPLTSSLVLRERLLEYITFIEHTVTSLNFTPLKLTLDIPTFCFIIQQSALSTQYQ